MEKRGRLFFSVIHKYIFSHSPYYYDVFKFKVEMLTNPAMVKIVHLNGSNGNIDCIEVLSFN